MSKKSNKSKQVTEDSSLIKKWWLSRNAELWKVFWIFWFIPGTLIRLLYVFSYHTVFTSLHISGSKSQIIALGILGLAFIPFDLISLYYIFKARLRCKIKLLALAALCVIGAYILNDTYSMLLLLHVK